jgi:hypothetical protein
MQNLFETMKVLNLLRINFPHIERDRRPEDLVAMFELYAELLGDLDPALLKAAAMQVMTECKFFPAVAELREKAIALTERANAQPDQTQAWDELMREVRRVGFMDWPRAQFSTPLIREIAKVYWRDACMTPEENLPTVRAQFRDSYNIRVRRLAEDARMLPQTRAIISQLAQRLDMGRRLLEARSGEVAHESE